jgi:hypothetical protein
MAFAFGCGWLVQVAAADALKLWWSWLRSALNRPQIRVFFASLRVFVALFPFLAIGRPIGIAAVFRLNS